MSEDQQIDLSKHTTLERVAQYYIKENIRLTPKEEEVRLRWEAAFSILCNFHSTEQTVQVLMSKFSYSRAQAYRDVQNSTRLFGDVSKSSKEGVRNILYEYAMRVFQLAASAKPPDLDQMNKAMANMIKIKGLDREDPEIPSFESLQQHNYNIVVDPKSIGLPEIQNLQQVIEEFKKKKRKKDILIHDADVVE